MKVLAFVVLLASSSPAVAQDIAGQSTVIDGDTIEIHGQRIRLWGIDAPESAQLCRGSDSELFRCGAAAANGLFDYIAGRVVTCLPRATDRYQRVVATCLADGVDLARWLVGAGLALDWPLYSRGVYSADQTMAKRASAGIWAGSFIEPWKYRACVRAGARPQACSDGD
jgi:endonuclease YncB( thermonuclease family)